MKPYILIEGSNNQTEDFESKVASALEAGYSLAGELVTQLLPPNEVLFFQPLFLDLEDEEDFEEEDFEEETEEF